MVAGRQGSLTETAQRNMAETTIENIREFELGRRGADLTNAAVPRYS